LEFERPNEIVEPESEELAPLLFTAVEAATQLRVSRSTIYGLMNCGKLHSVRIGTSRRIRRHDLLEFVNGLAIAD
jgi:excisionase family DNA binding protein